MAPSPDCVIAQALGAVTKCTLTRQHDWSKIAGRSRLPQCAEGMAGILPVGGGSVPRRVIAQALGA